jgi:hypothetical protein
MTAEEIRKTNPHPASESASDDAATVLEDLMESLRESDGSFIPYLYPERTTEQ